MAAPRKKVKGTRVYSSLILTADMAEGLEGTVSSFLPTTGRQVTTPYSSSYPVKALRGHEDIKKNLFGSNDGEEVDGGHDNHWTINCHLMDTPGSPVSHINYTCKSHVRHMYVTCNHMYVTCTPHVCHMYIA